jgi:5-methylcytosine-specific restriction endonuclease McrA
MRRYKELRRTRFKARYKPRPGLRQARAFVRSRADGRCEARVDAVCLGRGDAAHHIVPRSRGGSDDPANLLWICNAGCHAWIHANPEQAKARGLLRSREALAS